jgi:tRNA nucleotidyltransferase (CCA-adding enzyme)
MRLHPPEPVLEIAERLEGAGFEAWCVGGAVRDALLGHPHLDWDLATSAKPEEVRKLFGHRRTIPVGIDFGTVGVLDRDGKMHEVTTFRRDVQTDGRHAVVEFGVSLDDDLARRDFTINAIAYSPKRDELRDPFRGRADLEARLLRAVGDPDERMREDRLRALRAIRFAARFDFAIDDATYRAIAASAPYLGRLSPERVKQELDKTMEQVCRPSGALRVWQSTGAFATLLPEIADLSPRELAVVDFLAQPGLSRRPGRRMLRFAGLLSSLDGKTAARVMTSLRSSRAEVQGVGALVDRLHSFASPVAERLVQRAPTDLEVRRWVARLGRLEVPAVMRLVSARWAADRAAGVPAPGVSAVNALYRRMLRSAFRDPVDVGSLAIDGDDLRSAGIRPGPVLGRILAALLDAVIEDPSCNTRDWLLREAAVLDKRFRLESDGK